MPQLDNTRFAIAGPVVSATTLVRGTQTFVTNDILTVRYTSGILVGGPAVSVNFEVIH